LACGIGARALGMACQIPHADKLFLAGLLHDLGRLVLFSKAPDKAMEIFALRTQRKMLLREAEQAVLGFDHARLGEELLRFWHYPANLTQAVAFHHQPLAADVFPLESSVVHIADYLVHAMQMGNSGEIYVPPLNLAAWERVGLPIDGIDGIIQAIDDHIEAVQHAIAGLPPSASPSKAG